MICPSCGHKNPEASHECEKCGIYFIRWMIQQYRRQKTPGGRPAFRLPGASITASAALGLSLGLVGGFIAGRKFPQPAQTPWKSFAEIRVPRDAMAERLAGVIEDADGRLTPESLSGYFSQGVNSFTPRNLKDAAAAAGREVQAVPASPNEAGLINSPFKCLVEGRWAYSSSPPPVQAGTQECWALDERVWMDGALRKTWFFWEKLGWEPERGRWALFSPREEKELFERHIEASLGAEAEQADAAESAELVKSAGSDKEKLLSALATAYRTRARRAGALLRLEMLSK
ncbi:MAG: zinc ribbon domain-containing protein [Elusimicrobiota bacterium]